MAYKTRPLPPAQRPPGPKPQPPAQRPPGPKPLPPGQRAPKSTAQVVQHFAEQHQTGFGQRAAVDLTALYKNSSNPTAQQLHHFGATHKGFLREHPKVARKLGIQQVRKTKLKKLGG